MRLDEDRVVDALKALREDAVGKEASPAALEHVLGAFRARQQQRRRRSFWMGALAAAAVLIVAFATRALLRQPEIPAPIAAIEHSGPPRLPVVGPPPVLVAAEKPKAAVRKHRPRPVKAAPVQVAETWSDFVAVPYAPPLNGSEGGKVLRLQMPRATLQAYGFSMPVDRIFDRMNTEVMVGQDGVVRAIRFAK